MKIHISPAGFSRLQNYLVRFESMGWDSDRAAFGACGMVAIYPSAMGIKRGEGIEFIVDYSLDGPVWPFEDWPEEMVRGDPATYL